MKASFVVVVTLLLGFIEVGYAQQGAGSDPSQIQILPVQGNVYMLVGAGGNTTIQAGDEGVLVVDTKPQPLTAKVLEAIRSISRKPIRYLINTSMDPDHTGGNEEISRAGSTIAGGNVVAALRDASDGATIIAHQKVLDGMIIPRPGQPPVSSRALPMDVFPNDQKDLYFNGEAIQLLHQPNAHTDGDLIVFFRKSDVVSTGDVFLTTTYPVIDIEKGGTINGIVAALNRILDITIPKEKQEGGTMVISGHGRLCDEADVVEYRDMLTIVRDRIQTMIQKGMTLEQVKAARPTLDYDGRYGAMTGSWTTDMFIDAAYRSLAGGSK